MEESFETRWKELYFQTVKEISEKTNLSFPHEFFDKSYEYHMSHYLSNILSTVDEWGRENWDFYQFNGEIKSNGKMKKYEMFSYPDLEIHIRFTTLLRKAEDIHEDLYTPLYQLTTFTLESYEQWEKLVKEVKQERLKNICDNWKQYYEMLKHQQKMYEEKKQNESSSSSSSSESSEEDVEEKEKEKQKKKRRNKKKKGGEFLLPDLKEMESSSLGKLAEKISQKVNPNDLETMQNPAEFLSGMTNLMGKMMNPNATSTSGPSEPLPIEKIMGQVFQGLNEAITSGDVNQEDLMKDAQRMMGSLLSGATSGKRGHRQKAGQDPFTSMFTSMMGQMGAGKNVSNPLMDMMKAMGGKK